MEYLLIINNIILLTMLVLLTAMAILLFRYVRIFNNIHENTENLKNNLKQVNRTLTAGEEAELMKALD